MKKRRKNYQRIPVIWDYLPTFILIRHLPIHRKHWRFSTKITNQQRTITMVVAIIVKQVLQILASLVLVSPTSMSMTSKNSNHHRPYHHHRHNPSPPPHTTREQLEENWLAYWLFLSDFVVVDTFRTPHTFQYLQWGQQSHPIFLNNV